MEADRAAAVRRSPGFPHGGPDRPRASGPEAGTALRGRGDRGVTRIDPVCALDVNRDVAKRDVPIRNAAGLKPQQGTLSQVSSEEIVAVFEKVRERKILGR